MATKNKTSAPTASSAVDSPAGRAWLEQELKARRTELITGPANLGWAGNETLRAALEERIAFLEALLALVS